MRSIRCCPLCRKPSAMERLLQQPGSRAGRLCGPDRTRTDGLCDANAALSQLSYGPAGILAAGISSEIRLPAWAPGVLIFESA
jgi:hypothetical protein